MPEHVMQHADSPTWCIHCGTFDIYCAGDPECDGERTGTFDSGVPENFKRMLAGVFGQSCEKAAKGEK